MTVSSKTAPPQERSLRVSRFPRSSVIVLASRYSTSLSLLHECAYRAFLRAMSTQNERTITVIFGSPMRPSRSGALASEVGRRLETDGFRIREQLLIVWLIDNDHRYLEQTGDVLYRSGQAAIALLISHRLFFCHGIWAVRIGH